MEGQFRYVARLYYASPSIFLFGPNRTEQPHLFSVNDMPKLFDGTSLPFADSMQSWAQGQLFSLDCYGNFSEFLFFDMFVGIDAPARNATLRQVNIKYTNA